MNCQGIFIDGEKSLCYNDKLKDYGDFFAHWRILL